MEENRIPKRVLSMKLEATRPRGRPRNRWQDKVREDGSIVGREELQGKPFWRLCRKISKPLLYFW
jgi:hypothetical protein